jgi:preprotein translocase subunit SecA
MGRFGIPEDQPIENYLITRALENAQSKIEGFHFDARKHTLEYDDVMNFQRKVVYERRRKILLGNLDDVKSIGEDLFKEASPEELELIEKKKAELGDERFYQGLKIVLLQTADLFWVDHLEMMDYMRGSVNLRAYGQRDPLVEYKREGLRLFKEMQENIATEVFRLLPMMAVNVGPKPIEIHATPHVIPGEGSTSGVVHQNPPVDSNIAHAPRTDIGRNEPCPCGSGKKWKKCGELNTDEHQQFTAKSKK